MPCPPTVSGQWRWWCGNIYTSVCSQSGVNATLFDYPQGMPQRIVASDNATATNSTAGSDNFSCPPSRLRGACKANTVVPIGVGVGVGLPLALIAVAFGGLWWKERKRRGLHTSVSGAVTGAGGLQAPWRGRGYQELPKEQTDQHAQRWAGGGAEHGQQQEQAYELNAAPARPELYSTAIQK